MVWVDYGQNVCVLMQHCVDDCLVVERDTVIEEGYEAWRELVELCGWFIPDDKSPLPQARYVALGAQVDLTKLPKSPATFRITEKRRSALVADIKVLLEKRNVAPAEAGKLWGKLSHA